MVMMERLINRRGLFRENDGLELKGDGEGDWGLGELVLGRPSDVRALRPADGLGSPYNYLTTRT
jgi:hypothetical protein